MYRILIAGCGYVGSKIGSYFVQKKQKVWGIVRTETKKSALETLGITPLVCDLTIPESIPELPPVHFVVICPAPHERSEEAYRSIYLEAVAHFLEALKKSRKPDLIVYLSSTGVYRDENGEWVDENTQPEPDSDRGRILLQAEEQILNSGFPAIVFRLAGIYGPGRNRIKTVRQGEHLDFIEERDAFINMIHVNDIVEAMPHIFNKGQAGQVYLGVDDYPVKRSEFLFWLTKKLLPEKIHRLKGPHEQGVAGGKRLKNSKLKSLGVNLKYPTFREGYEELIQTEK